MIRHIALLFNFLIPGTGSLLLGKWWIGLAQLAVLLLSIISFASSFHTFYAVCAIAAVWFWGLFTAEWSPRNGRVANRERV